VRHDLRQAWGGEKRDQPMKESTPVRQEKGTQPNAGKRGKSQKRKKRGKKTSRWGDGLCQVLTETSATPI